MLCRGYGHVSAQCLNKSRTLIIETRSDSDQDGLDEIVHDPEGYAWEDDFDVDQAATLGCVLSMHPPSVEDVDKITRHLNVVRCALAQPKESDDWRRALIFQTHTKIGAKNCRVIIDSGSCVNVVTSNMATKVGLKTVPHPQPYRLSCVASIDVKDMCLILILFVTYSDKIWCDVVTMNAGHFILGDLGYMT